MNNCAQLTEAERDQIYALKQAGHQKSATASQLGRHRSTVGPSRRKNCLFNNAAKKAWPIISEEIWYVVNDFLCEDRSPEQISGWLSATKNLQVSHEHVMAALTGGARLKTGSRQIIAPASLKNILELVIGRWRR